MFRKVLIICIMLSVLFTGCKENEDANDNLKDEISEDKDSITIAFAHKSINSYFYTIMNEAVKHSVEEQGWNYELAIADYDADRQNSQIINFIENMPDAIITTAVDSNKIEDVVLLANQSNIPFCTIDTNATGGELTLDVSFDNYKAGQLAAKEIVVRLEEKYGSPRGVVFNAYGLLSSNAWKLRKEGFESIISLYPNITYVAANGKGEPQTVKKLLLEVLDQYGEVDAVHCSSEHPGRGLIEALKETNHYKKSSEKGHVILVTIDAEPFFLDLIKNDYADVAIAQDVIAYGRIVVDLLKQYVFEEKPRESGIYYDNNTYWKECNIEVISNQVKVIIPAYIINKDNCEDKRHWAYIAEYEWGFQYNK